MTDLDLMHPMTDTQRLLFQTEMLKHRKSVGVAAVLCFFIFGLQRFYLGQIGMGLLYACTAGLCLVGQLVDLLRIRSLVGSVNDVKAREVAAQILALPAGGGSSASGPVMAVPPIKRRTNMPGLLILLAIGLVLAWVSGAWR